MIAGGRRSRSLFLLLAVVALVLPAAIALADPRDDQIRALRDQIGSIRDDINHLSTDVDAMTRDLAEGQKKIDAAKATLQTTTTQTAELKKTLDAATTQQSSATAAMTALTTKLTREFETSPQYTATQKAVEDARRATDEAKDKALAPVRQTAWYKAAQAELVDAAAKVETLKHATPPDVDKMAAAMQAKLDADSKVAKMEQGVLASDADYQAARAKLEKAAADQSALRAKFQESLRTNSELAALLKQKQDARARELKARQDLQVANAQNAAARNDLNRLGSAFDGEAQERDRKAARIATQRDRLASLQNQLDMAIRNYNNIYTMPR